MILSYKPMPPLDLPCACGCHLRFIMPRRVRHSVKLHWRYRIEEIQNGDQWGAIKILEEHWFQPRHRRARRYWRDTRPRRFGRTPVRKYLTARA